MKNYSTHKRTEQHSKHTGLGYQLEDNEALEGTQQRTIIWTRIEIALFSLPFQIAKLGYVWNCRFNLET